MAVYAPCRFVAGYACELDRAGFVWDRRKQTQIFFEHSSWCFQTLTTRFASEAPTVAFW